MNKHVMGIAMGTLLSTSLLMGCAGQAPQSGTEPAASESTSAAESGTAESTSATESTTAESTSATESTTAEPTSTAESAAAESTTAEAPTTTSAAITEETAKQAALAHAGLAEADVTNLFVQKDIDDGIEVFEVEFNVGATEYSYDIDAATGAILSFEKDND